MIESEEQNRVARDKARALERAIAEFDPAARGRAGVNPRLVEAELEGMMSLLADLRREMDEWQWEKPVWGCARGDHELSPLKSEMVDDPRFPGHRRRRVWRTCTRCGDNLDVDLW